MRDLYKTASAGRRTALRKLARRAPRPETWVLFFMFLYMLTFTALTIWRHEVYSSARFDLGNMDQAVWNTAHGRFLQTTDMEGENISRLQNHADFLLLLFVPLYWVWASPYWLLVAQAAVVGLGALPLYWLARRFLSELPAGEWAAAFFPIAYLFNYGLQSANLFDFHAQTMAPTFLLFAFYYMLGRRVWAFVSFGVLAALCKEEISLIVAMMGLYAIWPLRRPGWGVPIFAGGVGYFLVIMGVVLPAFDSGGTDLISERYGAVGGSMTGVVSTAFTEPLFLAQYMFSGEKLEYLFTLASFSGFVGLLSPLILLIPLPELAINLLSDRPQMIDVHYQYSAPIIAFMYLAGAAGLGRLGRWALRVGGRMPALVFTLGFSAAVLAGSGLTDYGGGPFPINYNYTSNPVMMAPMTDRQKENIDGALDLIPPQASVSASNWIAPHLAHRRDLYLFPTINGAQYVVVDLGRPSYYEGVNLTLARLALERRVLENPDYRVIYHEENVAVFERVSQGVFHPPGGLS